MDVCKGRAAVARVKKNATHPPSSMLLCLVIDYQSRLVFYSTVGSWVNRLDGEPRIAVSGRYGDYRILIEERCCSVLLRSLTAIDNNHPKSRRV
jgi:hypothetical protein